MVTNNEMFARAKKIMPGGVNSPVRAFGSVGGTPIFIASATGAYLKDIEDKSYLDYVCSWGPLILGHAREEIVTAVSEAARRGLSYGACHEAEIELAELIQKAMPHLELLRLVNSGTEAAMSAVRLARGATGKDKIIKFTGCYHGHSDSFLIAAGSGALTFGTPSSPGVTKGAAQDTLLANYNDLDSVKQCFAENQKQVAAIIVEPVAGNMGVIPPASDFLKGLRSICDAEGALLIFDEVITGFRVNAGGAAELYQVKPDLTILGKIIGGGMPVGAYGGRRDLLEQISPLGGVYQAGTLSGNPLATAAGIATLKILGQPEFYLKLEQNAASLSEKMSENLKQVACKWCLNRVGSMFTLFLGVEKASTYQDLAEIDTGLFAKYHAAMLKQGIYLAPSQYEAGFISSAHGEEEIAKTLQAQAKALQEAKL